tara:strand:+ start:3889 stop:4701 length:813 start_codon:yes stop_codon:yes gene_type:complete
VIDRYSTPYGNVVVDVSAPVLVVRCGGGFDSAVLLYLVAKSAAKHNPDALIQNITVTCTNENDPESPDTHMFNNLPIVSKVVEWVQSVYPDLNIRKSHADAINWKAGENYINVQNQMVENYCDFDATKDKKFANKTGCTLVQDPFNHHVIDYSGVTKNPPIEFTGHYLDGNVNDFREKHRDVDHLQPAELDSCTVIVNKNVPRVQKQENFRNADKRVTVSLAKQLGIFDIVNNISWSCQGTREATNSWTKICNVCYWCMEREWAISHVYK